MVTGLKVRTPAVANQIHRQNSDNEVLTLLIWQPTYNLFSFGINQAYNVF